MKGPWAEGMGTTTETSVISIGFWGIVYYIYNTTDIVRNPRVVLVIIWAPISRAAGRRA